METTYPAIYRCRACRAAGRPDAFRLVFTRSSESPNRVTDQHGVQRLTHYGVPAVACPGCGRQTNGRKVEGRVVESIVCGAKCLAAKGPSCDCSCGGANHGANH